MVDITFIAKTESIIDISLSVLMGQSKSYFGVSFPQLALTISESLVKMPETTLVNGACV